MHVQITAYGILGHAHWVLSAFEMDALGIQTRTTVTHGIVAWDADAGLPEDLARAVVHSVEEKLGALGEAPF